MIDAVLDAIALIRELFADSFVALLCVAVAAPGLGVLLVLRRLPMLALAVPQTAACGQAAIYCLLGSAAMSSLWQIAGAAAGVLLGLAIMLCTSGDRRFLGVHAGVLYLVTLGVTDILYLKSPFDAAQQEAMQHGRLLTVLPGGRNQVLLAGLAILAATVMTYRRQWVAAFDPEQSALNGRPPRRSFALTLLLIGALCATCVPVVGPEVVLALLLIPAIVLRPHAPSMRALLPLAMLAGVLGSIAAFILACTEGLDLPPTPTLAITLLAASGVVALPSAAWTRLARRR